MTDITDTIEDLIEQNDSATDALESYLSGELQTAVSVEGIKYDPSTGDIMSFDISLPAVEDRTEAALGVFGAEAKSRVTVYIPDSDRSDG